MRDADGSAPRGCRPECLARSRSAPHGRDRRRHNKAAELLLVGALLPLPLPLPAGRERGASGSIDRVEEDEATRRDVGEELLSGHAWCALLLVVYELCSHIHP